MRRSHKKIKCQIERLYDAGFENEAEWFQDKLAVRRADLNWAKRCRQNPTLPFRSLASSSAAAEALVRFEQRLRAQDVVSKGNKDV